MCKHYGMPNNTYLIIVDIYGMNMDIFSAVWKLVNPSGFSVFLHKYDLKHKVRRTHLNKFDKNIILGHIFIVENDPVSQICEWKSM